MTSGDQLVQVHIEYGSCYSMGFPMTWREYVELEDELFSVIFGDDDGLLDVPLPGGEALPIEVEHIWWLRCLA